MLVVCLLFANLPVYAQGSTSLQLIREELKKTDYNVSVRKLNSKSIEKKFPNIESKLDELGFNEKLSEDNLILDASIQTESFLFEDKTTKEQVVITQRVYSSGKEEKVFVQIAYYVNSDFIVDIQADRINYEKETIEPFFKSNDYLNQYNKPNYSVYRMSLPSFPQWLCYLGEAIACGVYCTGIGLIALPAGVVCGAVCGGMFLIACSNAH